MPSHVRRKRTASFWLDLIGTGKTSIVLAQRRSAAFFRRLRLCIAMSKKRRLAVSLASLGAHPIVPML